MFRNLLLILLVCYTVLVLYASLMPLDFSASPEEVRIGMERMWQSWPLGDLRLSKTDAIVNVMIYVPLGLLAGTWLALRIAGPRGRLLALAAPVVLGAGLSWLVENLQAHLPGRTPAFSDLLLNTVGTLIGSLLAAMFGPAAWRALVGYVETRARRRPISLGATVLALAIAADAWCPWFPTMGFSGIRGNLRKAHWTLADGFATHDWTHWLIVVAGSWGLLTLLLGGTFARGNRWVRAGAWSAALAVVLECGKPAVMSRTLNVANLAVAIPAIVLAALLGRSLAPRVEARTKAILALLAVLVYIVRSELRPFTFSLSAETIRAGMPRGSDWIPLSHYARRARAEDVLLFGGTLLLAGGAAILARLVWSRLEARPRVVRALLLAAGLGAMGLVLEMCQLALPTRVASPTDVFTFALGGFLGGWIPVPRPGGTAFQAVPHRLDACATNKPVGPSSHSG